MILSKLFILGQEIELLWTDMKYHRDIRPNGKPLTEVMGGLITVCFPSDGNTDRILNWMTKESEDDTWEEIDKMEKGKVCFYENGFEFPPTRTYEFGDSHLVHFEETFSAEEDNPMKTIVTISPAIQDYGEEYVRSWNVTWIPAPEKTETGKSEEKKEEKKKNPKIVSIDWVNEKEEHISEIPYQKKAAVKVVLENVEDGDVQIKITKKDATEFETGKKYLTFSAAAKEGAVLLPLFKIKHSWEEFKTADTDKLVATATYKDVEKESKFLEISPTPKVLVNFRPHDNWQGEFGFDWLRIGDTNLFNDEKFEDVITKQYLESSFTNLQMDSNKYDGHFKKDNVQFEKLKKENYAPIEISWKKVTDSNGTKSNFKHHTEWLSLKKNKEAKIKLHIDVTDEADYLEFEDNANFTISPNRIDISGKSGIKKLNDIVTIKSEQIFSSDQKLVIKAYKDGHEISTLSGQLNVWANNVTKSKRVVFVQIKTKMSRTSSPNMVDATPEKSRINKYLEQAYVELSPDSEIVELDLTGDPDFSRFIKRGKVKTKSDRISSVPAVPATATTPAIPRKPAIPSERIVNYLKRKLKEKDNKYDGTAYFKAFYFAENGYHPSGGNLSGFSAANADYVVVFKSANDQTASHELLHSLNLAHTFTNIEASTNAEFTYYARKTDNLLDYSHHISGHTNSRCSLYYWQWKRANNSI
ncbi:type VI secretion system tube protein TssD [Aureivirga marina]|uniref:type VI secretion system tube protein TssD n=1 Tax=Aureivirga marina TaxID=1182451 RepID=UPI0018CAAE82|nr:type VI secretion system tube protein TssD [Aureivirga marina]